MKVIIKGLTPPYFLEDIKMWKLSLVVIPENGGDLTGGSLYVKNKKDIEKFVLGDVIDIEVNETKGGNTFKIKKSSTSRNLSKKKVVNSIKDPF